MPKPNTQRAGNLLASVTEEMLGGEIAIGLKDNTLRVDNILLELVRPHPVQPRRVLPEHLHQAFHQEKLTPTQAMRELIQLVQVAARQQSRPFSSVLEILAQPEDENEELPAFSPEEILLRELVNLAVTIRDDGQVNPLTVVEISQGVSRLYRIETGERRYWATWLLRDFIPNAGYDGTIPCIVIPNARASVFRQAKENTSRSGLTAIAMARQAALLLLSVHGYEIPSYPVNHDFYRQVLDLDLRSKREFTEAILSAMGGLSRMHFSHYKNLLRLSDEAIELADRYGLEEGLLRQVLSLPVETHAEMLQQIVQFKLTIKQVKDIIERREDTQEDENIPKPSVRAGKLVKLMRTIDTESPHDLAAVLLKEEQNVHLARARVQAMVAYLHETSRLLDQEKM